MAAYHFHVKAFERGGDVEVLIDYHAGRHIVPLVNVRDGEDQEFYDFWATPEPIALLQQLPGQQIAASCRWRPSKGAPWAAFSEEYRFDQFNSKRIVVTMGLDWASFVYKVSEDEFLPLAGCTPATTAPEDSASEGASDSTSAGSSAETPSASRQAGSRSANSAGALAPPLSEPRVAAAACDEGHGEGGQRHARPKRQPLMVVLRGLPFGITEAGLLKFIQASGAGSVVASADEGGQAPIRLLKNAQGRPSGFAEVDLLSPAEGEALKLIGALHMKQIGSRYVEVLPPKAPPRPRRCRRGGAS